MDILILIGLGNKYSVDYSEWKSSLMTKIMDSPEDFMTLFSSIMNFRL